MPIRACLAALALCLAACSATALGNGSDGGAARYDLAGADLAAFSDVGGPCGGFSSDPRQCLPDLVCVYHNVPDAPGDCERPDGGACLDNGRACTSNGDCCSGNCILRGTPGFCCQPGGCP